MSSAASGSRNDATEGKNSATSDVPSTDAATAPAVCSTTSAEAEQGDGPAASSASAAGSSGGETTTTAVSTSASTEYAAAACPVAVVAIGPNSAAAASEKCASTVSLTAASASGTAANGVKTSVLPEAQAEAYAEAMEIFRLIRNDLDIYYRTGAVPLNDPAPQNSGDPSAVRKTPAPPRASDTKGSSDGPPPQTERTPKMATATADIQSSMDAFERTLKSHNQNVQDELHALKDTLRNVSSQNQDIRKDILDLQREIMKSGSGSSAPAD